MRDYSRSHLSDPDLLDHAAAANAQERTAEADLLADLAEIDARKLYLPAAHSSMHAWCVGELGMSEDVASKRIHAARTARRFPEIFAELAAGRLHLSAVLMLAPYLRDATGDQATEIIAGAVHKTRPELERFLVGRLREPAGEHSPGDVESNGTGHAPGHVESSVAEHAPGHVPVLEMTTPQAPRHMVELDLETLEKLRYAGDLVSHQIPSGNAAKVIGRALDELIARLERRKFAATSRPRASSRAGTGTRCIPAEVRRAVWRRDGGRCTFESTNGRRCESRRFLEFDHAQEFARGGETTVDNLRLRCRAHNQYTAERAFGAGFMAHKRERGKAAHAVERTDENDVTPWLRRLGFRPDEARRAAARCEGMADASLEERVRFALRLLAPAHRRFAPPAT